MTSYIDAMQRPCDSIQRREAKRLVGQFITDATVTDGVVRWNSNDRVPPTDILELWRFVGLPFDFNKSLEEQDNDLQSFLAAYRTNDTGPSDEERFEARAAFGEGQELVNVITGRRWTT